MTGKKIGSGIAFMVAIGAVAGGIVAILHLTPAVTGLLIGIAIGATAGRRTLSGPPCGTKRN